MTAIYVSLYVVTAIATWGAANSWLCDVDRSGVDVVDAGAKACLIGLIWPLFGAAVVAYRLGRHPARWIFFIGAHAYRVARRERSLTAPTPPSYREPPRCPNCGQMWDEAQP